MSDRTVHATAPDGGQIVRYDRAGKWYLEYPTGRLRPCRQIKFAEAVKLASQIGSYVYLGKPGGRRFDAAISAPSNATQGPETA
jgi:hypothetical protein